ncbi:MAG TPA: DUF2784 domain-containing protein [Candidatus Dormibacteraeota bacterium]|nr:DUF2784 domain-containing protein [Candidatus Dormibacteraeota bacterium]
MLVKGTLRNVRYVTLTPESALALANVVLALHMAAALFIIFGLVTIPLGARLGWAFVHGFWWRLLHVAAMATVALQKLLGEMCFLTVWENRLLAVARHDPYHVPLIHTWGEQFIHVDLPMPFLVGFYTALWIYLIVLWFRVPPRLKPPAGLTRP